jgi:hypothetical protein
LLGAAPGRSLFAASTVRLSDQSVDRCSGTVEHRRIAPYLKERVGIHEDGVQLKRGLTCVPYGAQLTCLVGALNARLECGDFSCEGGRKRDRDGATAARELHRRGDDETSAGKDPALKESEPAFQQGAERGVSSSLELK